MKKRNLIALIISAVLFICLINTGSDLFKATIIAATVAAASIGILDFAARADGRSIPNING